MCCRAVAAGRDQRCHARARPRDLCSYPPHFARLIAENPAVDAAKRREAHLAKKRTDLEEKHSAAELRAEFQVLKDNGEATDPENMLDSPLGVYDPPDYAKLESDAVEAAERFKKDLEKKSPVVEERFAVVYDAAVQCGAIEIGNMKPRSTRSGPSIEDQMWQMMLKSARHVLLKAHNAAAEARTKKYFATRIAAYQYQLQIAATPSAHKVAEGAGGKKRVKVEATAGADGASGKKRKKDDGAEVAGASPSSEVAGASPSFSLGDFSPEQFSPTLGHCNQLADPLYYTQQPATPTPAIYTPTNQTPTNQTPTNQTPTNQHPETPAQWPP